jgi:hypothetical protein
MRLNIPVDTATLPILNGPGTQIMLDAALEKEKMGYEHPHGPRLEFTVANPVDGKPMKQAVEMIGNFEKYGSGYELDGLLVANGNFVKVKYWLHDDGSGRGEITDQF